MKFLIVAAAYGLIFVIVELLAKKLHPPGETTRKLSHILAGVGAALLPFVLTFNEIALLGALFVPAVYLSMRSNLFKSVHKVKRSTYGEVYFPLAIAVCALLFPDRLLFIYGVLVIGISDALASLLGLRYGRKKYKAPSGQKSFVGSSVFFVATTIIGATLVLSFINTSVATAVIWAVVLAAILTIIEARAKKGLDNLLVPVAASGLLGFLVTFGFFNSV
jgi:phytol kinase